MAKLIKTSNINGVTRQQWIDPNGVIHFTGTQRCDAILARNKEMRNHNDGFSKSRDWQRMASIPVGVVEMWKQSYNIDIFDPDPDMQKRVEKICMDSEWSKLRTSNGVF